MKKLVLTIVALFAVFTFIRAYSASNNQFEEKPQSAQVQSAVLH